MRNRRRVTGIAAGLLVGAAVAASAQTPAGVRSRHAGEAAWFEVGFGGGVYTLDRGGMGGGQVSMFVAPGLPVVAARASSMAYFTTTGVDVSEGGVLVGLRTPGQKLFAVGAAGFSYINAHRTCPAEEKNGAANACPDPDVKFHGGAVAYSIQVLKPTSPHTGIGLSLYGTAGSERASFRMFLINFQLGWFEL